MAHNRVLNSISDFFGDIGRARNASSIYSELSQLSDGALKARGLTREDLASHAFNKAFPSR